MYVYRRSFVRRKFIFRSFDETRTNRPYRSGILGINWFIEIIRQILHMNFKKCKFIMFSLLIHDTIVKADNFGSIVLADIF